MQVWKLYNTKTMDFHLFFCAKHAMELQVSRGIFLAICLSAWIHLTQPGPAQRLRLRTMAPCPCARRRPPKRSVTSAVLQALVVADEREDVTSKGVKLIWEEGKDEWASYVLAHMEAIRAKYFPKNVKDAKSKGIVEKALPSAKTVDHLADAAATNAPAGPMKVGFVAAYISRGQRRVEAVACCARAVSGAVLITREPPL